MSSGGLNQLPRACWWVAGASFINRLGAMVFPFLVLYLHRGLHLPLQQATAIAAFWGVGSMISGPLGGWAADRFDPVAILRGSLMGSGLLMLAFPYWSQPQVLIPATLLLALLADLTRPSILTALARLSPAHQRRDAFALNYLAINLGMSVGPTLAGFLAERDYRWLFWVDGLTSVMASLLLWWGEVRTRPETKHGPSPSGRLCGSVIRVLVLLAPCYWVFSTFFAAVPLFVVEELHLKERQCGLLWLLNTVVIVAFSLKLTRATASRPASHLLSLAAFSLALSYFILWWQPSPTGLLFSTLWLTLGEMLLFGNAHSYLSQLVPEGQLGKVMGAQALCVSLALIASAPTAGYFLARHQSPQLWLLQGLSAGLVAVGFALLPPGSPSPFKKAGPPTDLEDA